MKSFTLQAITLTLTLSLTASFTHAASIFEAKDTASALAQFTDEELNTEVEENVFELEEAGSDPELVTRDNLRLMGGGIASRKTGNSIALACYDEPCEKLRFVLFKSEKEAYFIGDIMKSAYSPDAKLQKKALRLVIQDYFDQHQSKYAENKKRRQSLVGFLLLTAGTAAIVCSGGSVLFIAAATPSAMFGGFLVLSSHSITNWLASGTLVEMSLSQTTGWNWSTKPKKVSDDNFTTIVDQIINGNNNVDRRQSWDDELRIDRKQNKLREKGVIFYR